MTGYPVRASSTSTGCPTGSTPACPGLLLALPELVALDLPGLVSAAGYPGTREIPAVSYVASLLATKLIALRRIGHVDVRRRRPRRRRVRRSVHHPQDHRAAHLLLPA